MVEKSIKKIIVASKNPTKIKAALAGFEAMFPQQNFEVESHPTASGVSDQPIGNEETYLGAYNRVQAAKAERPDADFWVGIEGGNIPHENGDMEVMAWMIVSSEDRMGKARTAGFFLPPRIIELVEQGYELGHADDIVFGMNDSKSSLGSGGLLTQGVIDRMNFYKPALIFALIPFKQPTLYPVS
ncbi:MAG: inosine/xanthosine triphosphatase [Bacteroidota bacterium]